MKTMPICKTMTFTISANCSLNFTILDENQKELMRSKNSGYVFDHVEEINFPETKRGMFLQGDNVILVDVE